MESRSRLKRDVPSGLARSTRALSAKCWVCWGDWLALPGRKPGALQSIEGSNPSTPTIAWSSRSLLARTSVEPTVAVHNSAAVA